MVPQALMLHNSISLGAVNCVEYRVHWVQGFGIIICVGAQRILLA
jgi:hypothetical protein